MPELQDHAHAAHLWPAAQHGDLAPGLWAFFCFDCKTDLESLSMPLKYLGNTSCLYSIFTACSEVKVQADFS